MPRDVLTPEFSGRSTQPAASVAAATMRRVDIPGVGVVEFPASMSDSDVAAAASRLHKQTNQTTASAEQFTPAPRMTRIAGDPSAAGFGANLLRGASDVVTSIPRVIRGLSKIDPAELPGQIASSVKERVQSYANDPLATIYDDPLSFLGDAATATGIGAAATAPLRAGAREVARQGARAATAGGKLATAGGKLATKAAPALTDAAIDMLPGGGMVRGGARAVVRAMRKPDAPTPQAAGLVDELAEGYDRYMPNRSAPSQPAAPPVREAGLPAELGPDVSAGPRVGGAFGKTPSDDAFARYTRRGLENPPSPAESQLLDALMSAETPPTTPKLLPKRAFSLEAGPYVDDPRGPMSFLRAQQKYDGPDGLDRIIDEGRPNLTQAGRTMLTREERDRLARAIRLSGE